jgi:hypothetical protein
MSGCPRPSIQNLQTLVIASAANWLAFRSGTHRTSRHIFLTSEALKRFPVEWPTASVLSDADLASDRAAADLENPLATCRYPFVKVVSSLRPWLRTADNGNVPSLLRPIMWVAIAGFAASFLVHVLALAGVTKPLRTRHLGTSHRHFRRLASHRSGSPANGEERETS